MQNAGTTWSLPGGTDSRGNDFLFDLQPRVSNAAGDPLDGVINVTPAKSSDPSSAVPTDRVVVSAIIPEAPTQSGDPVGDAPQHLIVSPSVGGAYHPAADTTNQAALLHLLVSSATASYYTTAGPDVNANAVPRTGDGAPTTLLADDGRVTVPASLAADIMRNLLPASQYGLRTLGTRLDEDLFSAKGVESKVQEQGLDDFFSQYPAIVQNGIVGSEEGLLAEKDLTGLFAPETAAFFFDDIGEDILAWLDDVRMP